MRVVMKNALQSLQTTGRRALSTLQRITNIIIVIVIVIVIVIIIIIIIIITIKMTPTLVTENFCLGVGFDPPVPIQQDQHNVQMISKYERSHNSLLIACAASASVCGRDCIQLLRIVIRVMTFVFCYLITRPNVQ